MKYEKYEKSKKKKTNCEKSKKAKEAAEKKAAQKSKFGEIEKAKKAEKAHANKTKIFAEHVHKLTIKTKSVKHARKKGVKKLAKVMKKLPVTVAKPTEPKATGTKANGHSKVNAKVKDYLAYKAAKARRGAKHQ